MTKKNPTKKKEAIPGVEYYTVGSGISKRTRWRVSSDNITPEAIEYMKKAFSSAPENSFERRVTSVEAQAKRILEAAGLPTDLKGWYSIPSGEKVTPPAPGRSGSLMALVEAHGFKERVDTEWYAAEILIDLRIVRKFIAEGNTVEAAAFAADLGALVQEARDKGLFAQSGKAGGKAEKALPPVASLVRYLCRKKKGASPTELWEVIPTDSIDGIKVDGHKFYRNGGRLLALRKADGCKDWRPAGKSLQYPSFRNRVTAARKTITR